MGLNSRQGGGSALDPDARLYIAAVETALGTPIATALPNATNPRRIISDFIKAEKAASRWSLHKRIYLPIYNNAAASAVDMISRTSGTFTGLGSVTHAAGYVHGDGVSGYFDPGSGSEPNTLGMSNSSASLFALLTNSATNTNVHIGSSTSTISAANRLQINSFASQMLAALPSNAISLALTDGIHDGVFIAGLTATNARYFHRRRTSGIVEVSNSSIDTTQLSTHRPFFMARNNTGTADLFSTSRVSVAGWGLGISQANAADFTLNLKTLWESLTGLTLP